MKTIIEMNNVTKILSHQKKPIVLVQDINIKVEKGDFIAVTGESGSGKSSLLYLMGLLDQPSSGTINILGQDMTTCSEKEKQRCRLKNIGFVFQFHFLLPEFTILQNIILPIKRLNILDNKQQLEKAHTLLQDLNIISLKDRYPHEISGGERQRAAIARALANNPSIILADEPTGNLDSKNSQNVFDIFKRICKQQQTSIILITHDPLLSKQSSIKFYMKDAKLTIQ